jgi:apolipoprotein N-acyltransferase
VGSLREPVAPALAAPSRGPGALTRTARAARLFLLAAGGAAIAISFLRPALWPLAWLGLGPLFALAPRAATTRRAAFEGWWTGLATNVPAFYWLVATIHRFGGFPLPIALFFYAVLSAFGALQFAGVAVLLRRAGPGASTLLAPAAWTASEFLFPNLFPWRLAHSQRDLLPLLQIGDATGPYGLSFAMAWIANVAVQRPFMIRRLAAPAAAIVLLCAYGSWRIRQVDEHVAAAPAFSVGVVQGNLALDEKRHVEHFEGNIERYRRLSFALAPTPDLIVWPETVVEWGLPREIDPPPELDAFPGAPAPLLFGAVSYSRRSASPLWYNSAFLRGVDGVVLGSYDKIVLMPFGEFIPLASKWPWLKTLSPATGDFQAGTGPGLLPVGPGARVGPLICYEDLLSGHVRATVDAGATLLASLANDAWFGDSPALHQHEMLALWRAIENRRYLVRATNTGLSSVVDPTGRRLSTMPVEREAGIVATTHLLDETTPYRRVGDAFAWATVIAAGLLSLGRRGPPEGVTRHEDAPPAQRPAADAEPEARRKPRRPGA